MRFSDEDFQKIIGNPDPVVISIRGQIAIESALTEVISHGLPEPHHLEVTRLTYPLKVDLAVALRGLRSESRPLFLKLNSIRNKFAHSPAATFEDVVTQEIKSCMATHQREMVGEHFLSADTPKDALIIGTVAAFYEARSAAEGLRKKRVHIEAWHEEVRDLIDSIGPVANPDVKSEFSKRLEARVKTKLDSE